MLADSAIALAAVAVWFILLWYCWIRPSRRHRKPAIQIASAADTTAIVYASQTGTALHLAQRTADGFGQQATLLAIDAITPAQLSEFRRALFIVSTYGEGDPPDMAQQFYRAMSAHRQEERKLEGLEAGILALGDDDYQHYCGFGVALETWLRQQGAALLFNTVKVNRCNAADLHLWETRLADHFQVVLGDEAPFHAWTLVERTLLNPAGLGRPCFELTWKPANDQIPPWSAGDIAQLRIGDADETREYSIASVPAEGHLRLLVRQHQAPDGTPGLGSGWLCAQLPVGHQAKIRIRPNPLFHAPDDDRPAVFIGNGTGIAGLRSLLQERINRGHYDNWLIFGERSRNTDFHWAGLLESWQQDGYLQRMDLAFSREQAGKRYVHHLLQDSAEAVANWAARGAVFYVCGSKDGMAQDVDRALRELLGKHGYEDLVDRRGYRRDVY